MRPESFKCRSIAGGLRFLSLTPIFANAVAVRDRVSQGASLTRCDPAAGGFKFDTSIPGNWNTGHDGPDYGTSTLTDEQRWQLVEYLKTL